MMLVSLNLVQFEDLPTSSGQLFDGVTQYNAINRPTEVQVLFLNLAFERWRVFRDRFSGDLCSTSSIRCCTTTRYNQVEKAEPPRNELRLRNAWMKASCVRSFCFSNIVAYHCHQSKTTPCSARVQVGDKNIEGFSDDPPESAEDGRRSNHTRVVVFQILLHRARM
jgi:hypothetical protein